MLAGPYFVLSSGLGAGVTDTELQVPLPYP